MDTSSFINNDLSNQLKRPNLAEFNFNPTQLELITKQYQQMLHTLGSLSSMNQMSMGIPFSYGSPSLTSDNDLSSIHYQNYLYQLMIQSHMVSLGLLAMDPNNLKEMIPPNNHIPSSQNFIKSDGKKKRKRTNYKDPENASKLASALSVMINQHDSTETPMDMKTVARMFDVPYNTLRDNYLKLTNGQPLYKKKSINSSKPIVTSDMQPIFKIVDSIIPNPNEDGNNVEKSNDKDFNTISDDERSEKSHDSTDKAVIQNFTSTNQYCI